MTENRLHVVPDNGQWTIKEEGADEAVASYPARDTAVDEALALAARHPTSVVLHDESGRFGEVIRAEELEGADAPRRATPTADEDSPVERIDWRSVAFGVAGLWVLSRLLAPRR